MDDWGYPHFRNPPYGFVICHCSFRIPEESIVINHHILGYPMSDWLTHHIRQELSFFNKWKENQIIPTISGCYFWVLWPRRHLKLSREIAGGGGYGGFKDCWSSFPTNRMVVLIDGPPQQIGWLFQLAWILLPFFIGGPTTRWCQHKYLANLPGHTMALALKYRLLCGSVVVSSPLMYHEWYYSYWLVLLQCFTCIYIYILYFQPCGWDNPHIFTFFPFCIFFGAVFQKHQVSSRTRSTSFRWISPGPRQRMSWRHFGPTQRWPEASELERGSGQRVTWQRRGLDQRLGYHTRSGKSRSSQGLEFGPFIIIIYRKSYHKYQGEYMS